MVATAVRNRLRIKVDGEQLRLSWRRGQDEDARSASPVDFAHPFDQAALDELRWYLEQYLQFPYGLEPERAGRLEQQMQVWGRQLFDLVFRGSEKARDFFQEATRSGLDTCELAVSCDNPAVLNLPWELLYNEDYGYLAPLLGGMSRSLNSQAVRSEMPEMPQDRLNILLVIARPYGERDIPLGTVSRPVLEALKPLGDRVFLKILRPPSFAAFEQELNAHKGFYHIVHFDGHGTFDPNAQGMRSSFGSMGQGVLVFEQRDGSEEIVTAERIAQNLQDCRVPIFLLNACKSGQAGEEEFSSVAGQLVRLGAKSVVAMAYSVYAVAAREFIGRLYQELVNGATVSAAVAAGRRQVLNQAKRPSPKGDLSLQDWLVPVLYQQARYAPFKPQERKLGLEAMLEGQATEPEAPALVAVPDESAYGFIGRDYDLLRLERAFRQSHVALLRGMGGVGKTELACGWARWLMRTQGREQVFFTSFERGAGLQQVVNQIGRSLMGDRFSQFSFEQQRGAVEQYLQQNRCLLIWDNFEPVNGFPAGNPPLLNEAERADLKSFLKALRGGQSWVLITSRREEAWLDCGYQLLNLAGFNQLDAAEFAAQVLAQAGVDRSKLSSDYVALLKLLGGHPFALRVVLPKLARQAAGEVLASLRQGLAEVDTTEEGRDKSLTASLDYSFAGLSARARQHLPFLGLFVQRVNTNWLSAFSKDAEDDFGQAYQAVFGENLDKAAWDAVLEEAVAAGIVERWGDGIYQIHPALPWFLRQRLDTSESPPALNSGGEPSPAVSQLEQQLMMFYVMLAENYRNRLVDNAQLAMFVLQVEEPNLLQQLRLAEQQAAWSEVQFLLQALGEMYQRIGRKPELAALRDRVLSYVGEHLADARAKGRDAFDLWMYARGGNANEALQVGNLEVAKAIFQEILTELASLDDDTVLGKIAALYHNLGMVAQEQRDFDAAVQYYQKALKIKEDAGDAYNAASDYHQLGMVAQEQRDFDAAVQYYQKALKIYEDAGDAYNAADEYHNLGMVAQEQRDFDAAVQYYQKALKIYEDAGDAYNAADEYHNLGMVAQEQRDFDAAVQYYQKALKIKEDAGDAYNAASDYHQLGMVAQEQRDFDAAVQYYQKALKIYEDAGDAYNAADEYHNLG
ncbi:tetratricopeptide repeat protein, partial [filamentous cyanobacterium LEGE 11480]